MFCNYATASDPQYSLLEDFSEILVTTGQSRLKSPEVKPIEQSLVNLMASIDETEEQLLVLISLESPKNKRVKNFPVICRNNKAGLLFLKEMLNKNITDERFPKKEPLLFSCIIAK